MNVNPKKRLRTDAQLARKRHADKVNHKAKRDRTKSQMDRLECEMIELRQHCQDISEQLCVLHADVLRTHTGPQPLALKEDSLPALPNIPLSTDTCAQPSLAFPSPQNFGSGGRVPSHLDSGIANDSCQDPRYSFSSSVSPSTISNSAASDYTTASAVIGPRPLAPAPPPNVATGASSDLQPFRPIQPQQQAPSPPASSVPNYLANDSINWDGMESLLDALSEHQNRVQVDCRCGVEHKSPKECLEYSTFLILLRAHENLSKCIHDTPPSLPRDPSLVSVFRHSCSSNPIVHILGSIFSRIHPVNVFTLFGIFLGMYRFLRVRLFSMSFFFFFFFFID